MAGTGARAIDRAWLTAAGQAQPDGTQQASFPPVGSGEEWEIDAIVLSTKPYVPCQAALYLDDVSPPNFLTKSLDAGQDVFEGLMLIESGRALLVVWTGAGSAGTSARIHRTRLHVENLPVDPTLLRRFA